MFLLKVQEIFKKDYYFLEIYFIFVIKLDKFKNCNYFNKKLREKPLTILSISLISGLSAVTAMRLLTH